MEWIWPPYIYDPHKNNTPNWHKFKIRKPTRRSTPEDINGEHSGWEGEVGVWPDPLPPDQSPLPFVDWPDPVPPIVVHVKALDSCSVEITISPVDTGEKDKEGKPLLGSKTITLPNRTKDEKKELKDWIAGIPEAPRIADRGQDEQYKVKFYAVLTAPGEVSAEATILTKSRALGPIHFRQRLQQPARRVEPRDEPSEALTSQSMHEQGRDGSTTPASVGHDTVSNPSVGR